MTFGDVLELVLDEVDRAEKLHPKWPDDIIHAVGIVCEESGEAMKAALDHVYFDADLTLVELEKELTHTAATAFRALMNLRKE